MRALGIFVVVLILVLLVGLLSGWFRITHDDTEDGARIGLEVHGDEVERDMGETKRAVEGIGRRIGDALDDDDDARSIEGFLGTVDPEAGLLTVRGSDDELETVLLDGAVQVELDGRSATLGELRAGDRVSIAVREVGEVARATRIVAERRDG